MTETVYREPLNSFESGIIPAASYTVPVLQQGRSALERVGYVQIVQSLPC
jgi:hypothetical protein